MLTALYIILALLVVSAGAELLVRSASLLALRAGVSPLFVGLTIVGFGTSSPELGASVTATLQGLNDVSVGNVIGSSIFNLAFILGITAIICPIKIQLSAVRSDLLIAIAAALIPFVALIFGGVIPRLVGFILVFSLGLFILRAYKLGRQAPREEKNLAENQLGDTLIISTEPENVFDSMWLNCIFVFSALAMLILGSKAFVENAVTLARSFQISELVIGLTVVSVGTSLPELVTSVIAVRKHNTDIAVGNIIGSNIFNLMGILGICAAIKPQTVSKQVLFLDAPVLLIASLAMLPIMKSDGCISRREGFILLFGYIGYLSLLLFRT